MVSAIRISITVQKYSPADLAGDIFDGLLWLYRFSVKLYHFIYSVIKKFLIAVLIVEITGIVLIFTAFGVIGVIDSLMK